MNADSQFDAGRTDVPTLHHAPFQRWIWTELLAFDVRRPDHGASEYLDTLGFVPDAISLLISSPDMILQHAGIEQDRQLPPDSCTRNGHDGNEIRRRQVWTAHQLRSLIATLRKAGVAVYLSGFTDYLENAFHPEWLADHPECRIVFADKGRCNGLNILSRMTDGTFLEDFFVRQLSQVCLDYGFNGWHGPDGYGPFFPPLHIVDCSDDMIDQFIHWGQRDLPEVVTRPSHDHLENLQARMDWIWRHKRLEWIGFYVDRWACFWGKIATALHSIGRKAVVNSAWTRDPFEAIYRYGLNYRKLIDAGVDGIVVETVAGGLSLLDKTRDHHFEHLAMLMLIRAHVPDAQLICICNTKDVVEDWDLLRHSPATIERETHALSNVYYITKAGPPRRCSDGFLACLGDGISSTEWRELHRHWRNAFYPPPDRIHGAALVWSGRWLEHEIAEYGLKRRWSTHRILHHLLACRAPVHAVVNIEDARSASMPLLVIHPHLLDSSERETLLGLNHPLVAIGYDFDQWPAGSLVFSDLLNLDPMQCRLYNGKIDFNPVLSPPDEPLAPMAEDRWNLPEPSYYRTDLPWLPVSASFIHSCAMLIGQLGANYTLNGDSADGLLGLMAVQLGNGVDRVAVTSLDTVYQRANLRAPRPVDRVVVKSLFPVTTVHPSGNQFTLVIPPRGAVICDVYYGEKG